MSISGVGAPPASGGQLTEKNKVDRKAIGKKDISAHAKLIEPTDANDHNVLHLEYLPTEQ